MAAFIQRFGVDGVITDNPDPMPVPSELLRVEERRERPTRATGDRIHAAAAEIRLPPCLSPVETPPPSRGWPGADSAILSAVRVRHQARRRGGRRSSRAG